MVRINKKKHGRSDHEQNVIVYQNSFSLPDSATCLHSVVLSPKHLRHQGFAYIWAVVFMLLIILLVGLSLDTAKVSLVINQLQNAADAAALAGANIVKTDRSGAREQAQIIAGLNFADETAVVLDLNIENYPDGDIVIGWYNRETRTFTPALGDSDAVNAMVVIAPRTQERGESVSLNFGSIANVDTVDLAGNWQMKSGIYAIAMCAGGTGAGLVALAPTGVGLYMNGNFTLDVSTIDPALPSDGEIQVNSESWNAVDIDGTSTQVEASAMNIYGGIDISSNYDLGVPYSTGVPPIPDPLAWLPPPTWNPLDDKSPGTGNTIIINEQQPDGSDYVFTEGYYSGGFNINSSDPNNPPNVRFGPGIYILDGRSTGLKAGLVVGGNANVYSDRAMFYITGDGILSIQGNGEIQATPPTSEISATYEGVTIFQDRDNTNEALIKGTADLELDGTLYFPTADPVNIRGGGWGFGNQLIGYRFDIRGQGVVGINYDGRNRAPVTISFLVE